MVKKLLLVCALIVGLIYGTGGDLGSIKRSITGAANGNARTVMAGDDGGWSTDSGY